MKYEIMLEAVSPIHTGVGGGSSSDIPIRKNDEGDILLFGSSLKGVLREKLAYFADALEKPHMHSMITDLFGFTEKNKAYKGRIAVNDAVIPKNALIVKNFTPIDRIFHVPLVPLKIEAIKPGTRFTLKFELKNPNSYEVGFIALIIREMLHERFTIGSSIARGFGITKIQAVKATLEHFENKNVVEFLDGIEMPMVDWEEQSHVFSSLYKVYQRQCTERDEIQKLLNQMQYAVDELSVRLNEVNES